MNNGLHSIQARGGGMEVKPAFATVHIKSSKKLCRGSFFFCKFMNARSVLQVFGVNRSDRINRLSESDDAMRIMLLLMTAWGG